MRRFLNFRKENQNDELNDDLVNVPSLPNDVSYSELIHRTKRGFLAKKMAFYLEMDQKELDTVYFLSLSEKVFDSFKEASLNHQLVYCSERLLDWIKTDKEVKKKIDELPVNTQFKNAILKAFDIHKNCLIDNTTQENQLSQKNVNEKWKIYRDVIYSATQERLLLINKEEAEALKSGDVLVENKVKVISDIPKSRMEVKTKLESAGYKKSELMSWLLVISEAITNTLKHAEEGKLTVIEDKEKSALRVIVEDKGSGFQLENLPKATLMAGYSTKKSLGQGFQLMLKMANQIFLYTSNQGSTVIVTFEVNRSGDKLNGTS